MSGLGVLVNDGGASEEFIYKIIAPTSSSKDAVLDISNEVISGLAPVQSVANKTGDVVLTAEDIAIDTIGTTSVNTLQDSLSIFWSAGVISGGDLTKNMDGTVSIAQCEATLRPTADSHSPLRVLTVPARANLVLQDNSTSYIFIDYNLGNPIYSISTSTSAFNCLDKCLAWVVSRENLELHIVDAREQNVDLSTKLRRLFLDFSKFIHAQGGSILSASNLNLRVTAGKFYYMVRSISHNAFDTTIAGTNIQNVFCSYYRNGSDGWNKTVNNKSVSTTLYDAGTGTLATIGNNKFVNHWIYLILNTPPILATVYGQNEYNSLDLALEEGAPASLPQALSGTGVLLGRVTFQKSATVFSKVETAFAQGFSASASTDHNMLAGLQGGALNEYYHLTSTEYSGLLIKSFLDSFDKSKRNADSITNTYDDFNKLVSQSITENSIVVYTVTYTYSGDVLSSKTISKTSDGSVVLNYSYDIDGKLTTITQIGGD